MSDISLNVEDLSVSYPGYSHFAVEHISFSVEEGTIAALIGPNGSGKSTIIKSILGLLDYQGKIEIYGKPAQKALGTIGYVPQRFSFDPTFPLTVEEFVLMTLISEKNKNDLLSEALSYVDALDLRNRKLSTLSGGQLQRVLLARALVKKPSLLLLDEPEAGIDVGGEQTFYDLMEKLVKDEKITALVASHELDVVYAYAQKVVCVNRTMLCYGVPQKVLNQETFEKLYGRGLKFYGHYSPHHKHN